jgi:uncharacterized protein involved in exopolysaccharide biosynthesis
VSNAVRHESTIRDYARVLIRNWWIVLAPIVLVPVLAYLIAAHQPARYQATASVYLKEADIGALVSGLQNVTPEDPARVAATQIILAQTPFVADRVLRAAGVTSEDPNTLLASTQITADPSADILYFTVEDHDPVRATRLANAYAAEYTVVRRSLDTGSLRQAVSDLLKRSAALRAQGRGAYAASLTAKAQQLQTLAVLESSNAVLARPAATAAHVAPRPRR